MYIYIHIRYVNMFVVENTILYPVYPYEKLLVQCFRHRPKVFTFPVYDNL